MYDLNSKFDIEMHKKTFVNYFEVVVLSDGTVEYAVPSHQEKLISLCMKKCGCTRDELDAKCPVDYYFDFCKWLCMVSGAVSVWPVCIQYGNGVTQKQMDQLKLFVKEGLLDKRALRGVKLR